MSGVMGGVAYSSLELRFLIGLLTFALIVSFSVSNLFLFYVSFEFSLIPIFFIILGWGYRAERIQAGFYMFFYTFVAALPFLLSLL